MNWISPTKKLPKNGEIYFVLFKDKEKILITMAEAAYPRKWDNKIEKYTYPRTKKMLWISLYAQAKNKSCHIKGRGKQSLLDVMPHDFPVHDSIAYIKISDVVYPIDLINNYSICKCKNVLCSEK